MMYLSIHKTNYSEAIPKSSLNNDMFFSNRFNKDIQVYVRDTKGNFHTTDTNPYIFVEDFRNKVCDY